MDLTDRIAARRKHFEYAQELFENALSLDPTDPYLHLLAVEELYEPQQRWKDILHVFRLLPEIDPAREFALEARSLRQSLLETIIDSDATNAQIHALYHVCDGSQRHATNAGVGEEADDYYGRALLNVDGEMVNDGWDTFGYDHHKHVDHAHEKDLRPFLLPGYKENPALEDVRALEFYPKLPDSLRESYSNYNWYEIPLMREWLPELPTTSPTGEDTVDWNTLRNDAGRLEIPHERIFDKDGKFQVTLKQLESLHDLLAKEYETLPAEVLEGEKQLEHCYELKSQEQLLREVRKRQGDKLFDFTDFDSDLKLPTEREDVILSNLLRESMRVFAKKSEELEENTKEGDGQQKGEKRGREERNGRKKAW